MSNPVGGFIGLVGASQPADRDTRDSRRGLGVKSTGVARLAGSSSRAAAAVTAAALVLVVSPGPLAAGGRTATEARSVATKFFRTINARQYAQTCDLLSEAYFAR